MKLRKIKDMTIRPDFDDEARSGIQPIPVENLEAGMPTVVEAEHKLASVLQRYRKKGEPVLKIIHGYGSSGVGGALRVELRQWLYGKVKSGAIVDIIPGEDFERGIKVNSHLKHFPQLEWDSDYGRRNAGVTIILIQKPKK